MISCEFENGNLAHLRHFTVDAVVVDKTGGQVLLTRRSLDQISEPGKWCLPGGYVDRDETMYEAIRRELMEETGYEAASVRPFLLAHDPRRKGDDRQNVGMAFLIEADARTGEHDHEVIDMQWFPLDALPSDDEMAFDHADTITLYQRWRAEQFPLPVVDEFSK